MINKPSKPPICPGCGVNPAEWDSDMKDFIYCESCRNKPRTILPFELNSMKTGAGIPPRYRSACLRNFPEKVQTSALDVIASDTNISLWGTTGKGKTHLLTAMADYVMNMGIKKSIKFLTMTDLTEQAHNAMDEHRYQKWLRELMEVDILILDDVGTQKETEFKNSLLYDIINFRYNEYLITWITCNKEPSTFLDARISRRILEESKLIELKNCYKPEEVSI